MKRRAFIGRTALGAATLGGAALRSRVAGKDSGFIPEAEAITGGDQQHWFGYYGKWQIDASGRFALGCKVNTFFRSPTPKDVLRVGLIDLHQDNRWREIGRSTAWGWQQSCMLQWVPGSDREVIWNDHETEGFVSRIHDIRTGKTRTLPRAIYTLSPTGDYALCVDFDRLQFFRPGYGYPAKQPASRHAKAPDDAGIYRMDLKTGTSKLIISYAQIAKLTRPAGSVADNFHWFNHFLVNPSGTRFIFLNRSRPVASPDEMSAWLKGPGKGAGFRGRWITRALTADTLGGEIRPLNDSGLFSHFIWKGDDIVTAWAIPDGGSAAGFFELPDGPGKPRQVGKGIMIRDGHNTYVPHTDNAWILNDTYPAGPEREQELYLFHTPTNRKVTLGRFHEPPKFRGEFRCDLHPRCDQQGDRVFFDSTHAHNKRQIYSVEIGHIVRA